MSLLVMVHVLLLALSFHNFNDFHDFCDFYDFHNFHGTFGLSFMLSVMGSSNLGT